MPIQSKSNILTRKDTFRCFATNSELKCLYGSRLESGQQSGSHVSVQAAIKDEKNSGNFRFWHDERRFKGPGDRCLVQRALYEAGKHRL